MVDINRERGHNPSDKKAALAAAVQALDYDASDEAEIPIGVLWESRTPTFEERVAGIRKPSTDKPTLQSILKNFAL
jgi:2-oxoglutarate ferredoxin oxidoreductase subunit beta